MGISQSMTIARYLAKETGLAGKCAMADSVVDQLQDMFGKMIQAKFAKDEEKGAKMKEFFEGILTSTLTNLEKWLKGDWFVGNSMTWADIHFMTCADHHVAANPGTFEKYPKLAALNTRVS